MSRRNLPTALLLTILLTAPTIARGTQVQGPEVTVSHLAIDQYAPRVAYNSKHNEYLVVWHNKWPIQPRDVVGKRLDSYGNVIAEFTIAEDTSKGYGQPAAAYDPVNDRYLVTYLHDVNGDGSDYNVRARLVPWNGPSAALQEFDVCTWTSQQWNPRVDYAGTQQEFLVVWTNESSGGVPGYVSGQRISSSGGLSGASITIASSILSGDSDERVNPDVAYNHARNEYLIVFQRMTVATSGDIYAVRMNAGGSILGGGEFAVASWPDNETLPRVAASHVANQWIVAWQSTVAGLDAVYARGVKVNNTTAAIEFWGPVEVFSSVYNDSAPDIACYPSADRCLVVFQQQYDSPSIGKFGIFGRTLGQDGSLGDYFEVRPLYSGETTTCASPTIAAGQAGWLVAWEHDQDPASFDNQDIHARAVYQLFADGLETGDFSVWSSVQQ